MSAQYLGQLLLTLAVVIMVTQAFGLLARRVGQPKVLGEIVAGIFLGPLLMEQDGLRQFLPTDVRSALETLGSIGLALFMCMIGAELAAGTDRRHMRQASVVSIGSALVPFALGSALALLLLVRHPVPNRAGFVIFFGAAMLVTALPVLARILSDCNLTRSAVGVTSMAAAAVCDVFAWSLLGLAAALDGADQWRLLLAPVYLGVLFGCVIPLLRKAFAPPTPLRRVLFPAAMLLGLVGSCAAAEWLGLHLVFGSLVWGVVVQRGLPRGTSLRPTSTVQRRISRLLLPVYFFVAGLGVSLQGFGLGSAAEFLLILVTAVGAKAIGTYGAARWNGASVDDARLLSVLLNVRGLTELVILAAGRELGLLDDQLYTLMVLMALVTTLGSGPLLARWSRQHACAARPRTSERAAALPGDSRS